MVWGDRLCADAFEALLCRQLAYQLSVDPNVPRVDRRRAQVQLLSNLRKGLLEEVLPVSDE